MKASIPRIPKTAAGRDALRFVLGLPHQPAADQRLTEIDWDLASKDFERAFGHKDNADG